MADQGRYRLRVRDNATGYAARDAGQWVHPEADAFTSLDDAHMHTRTMPNGDQIDIIDLTSTTGAS